MKKKGFRFSILSVMVLTSFVAILIAIPRQLAGTEMHPNSIRWFVTLHEILVATTASLVVWILLSRRKIVAFALAVVIVVLFGPNTIACLEYTLTGEQAVTTSIVDKLGVTEMYNLFYIHLYEMMGYDFTPLQR